MRTTKFRSRKRGVWMRVREPQALRRWRERRSLTQRDLAYLCKCSQNAIYLLESGRMATLSEDLALTIAKRLDVPWEDLFEARSDAGLRRVSTGIRTNVREVAA